MTPLQLKVLETVREDLIAIGYAPTIRELARRLDVGVGEAHKAVTALVEQGKLKRIPGVARGLTIGDRPDLRVVDTDSLEAELGRRGITFRALSRFAPMKKGYAPTCAADTCGEEVRPGMLMCRAHWFLLPRALRDEIMAAFGRRDAVGYEQAVTRARDLVDRCGDGFRRRA